MCKKGLLTVIVLFLIFSFLTQAISAKADDLVIQDDGKVVLVITNNGVLGVSTSPKEPEKTTAPTPQANPQKNTPPPHSEQKQQSSPRPSNPAPQAPAKTVPLVPPKTESIVQINPPINNDKKIQVIITTGTKQPVTNTIIQTSPTQTPTVPTTHTGTIQTNTKLTKTTPANVITKSVDQVVAQGANGKPVITIKSDQAHQLTITQGSTQVTTFLPLQIDTLTHSLSVSSQKQPIINVLPSEALQGILDEGLLNTQNIHQARINLTQDASGINYTVNSQKQGKLFGVFSVKSPVQVKLSAQTGKVIKASQSLLFNVFGAFVK